MLAWQLAICAGVPVQELNCDIAEGQSVADATPLAIKILTANANLSCLTITASPKQSPHLLKVYYFLLSRAFFTDFL
jgi:hypothetical protein